MTALAILDLGYGNTRSVALAFERLGAAPVLTDDPAVAASADRLVLPGVGAAGYAMGRIDALGLRDNTIVVFTSDNGATKDGTNLPFRGGKHSLFEGGTHLPTVIHWPNGKVVSGKWDGLCGALDMFPTLMAMADLKMPETRFWTKRGVTNS